MAEGGKHEDDYLVALITEILGHCEGKIEALHTLEQKLCDSIRSTKKKHFSSFHELSGQSFSSFIESHPDHFAIDNDGRDFLVSLAKQKQKKKKGKKGHTKSQEQNSFAARACINDEPVRASVSDQQWYSPDDEDEQTSAAASGSGQWQEVKRKGAKPKKTDTRLKTITGAAEKTDSSCQPSTEELKIQQLVNKPSSDILIFQATEDVYMLDRTKFIKDVTSLWNTPRRDTAHILLGVRECPQPPHQLLGIQSSTEESVYKSMLDGNLFDFPPRFRYFEVKCEEVLIGVVEIEGSPASPSVVCNDNLAVAGLKKGVLFTRKNKQNMPVMPDNPLYNSVVQRLCAKSANHQLSHTNEPKGMTNAKRTASQPSCQPVQESHSQSTPANPPRQDKTYAASATAPSQPKLLMKALNNFQKVHFVLICGSMSLTTQNIDALAAAPWVAVYDFNVQGRDTGLLGILEDSIMRKRSLSILTWCDSCKGITEKGTQWWSLRGRREIPESHTADDYKEWLKQVKDKLEKLCQELARFAEDYTILSVLVLWPDSELEARCMHKFLGRLQENVQSKIVICFPDSTKDYDQSKTAKLVRLDFEDDIEEFHVNLGDFCAEIELLTQNSLPPEKFQFQLPSAESGVATLEEKDAAWLTQEMEVLYLQSPHTKVLPDQDLKKEADNFFRGGTISWFTLYDPKYEHFDIKRMVAKDITSYIQKEFIDDGRNGMVTVYHAPGAGGSTMARRILWEMRDKAPCVHVMQRSGSAMEEVAVRLEFLYNRCKVPVIALMDGEDERRIKQLSKQLQRHNVVILYVKRYPYSSKDIKPSKGKFYLPGTVHSKESEKLITRYMKQCEGDTTKIDELLKMNQEVKEDTQQHQMYEYGMTVYHHEFRGVRSYVKGHLQLAENRQKDLQQWQKCLGFLALVYFYGQSSLPCQFFAKLLEKQPNYKVDLDDFPHQVRVFVVQDRNEGKNQCIRIGHYIIAKEILEQVLSRRLRSASGKTLSDRLSAEAQRNLKDFSIDFIKFATRKQIKASLTSQIISYILTKVFIFRDNAETNDIDAQGLEPSTKKKPQFSQIMSDLDSNPPYHGRLEVLQKLCDAFPNNPNFRAHLGRFYTCCRPEAEKEAEKHFTEALRLCNAQSPTKDGDDIDDKSKLTLMHVYHMYGMFFQVRIDRLVKMNQHDQENMELFNEYLGRIVSDANEACEKFIKSRNATPFGQEESYIFTNEIHVRLRVCDFVNRYFPENMRGFLCQTRGDWVDTAQSFVIESVMEIDSLIMECWDVQMDEVFLLKKYVNWFHTLFSSCTKEIQRLLKTDRLASLHLTVTATKLKFRRPDDILWSDGHMPEEHVVRLVSLLENIFQEDYEDVEGRNRVKSRLEMDYKDWLLAIRLPHFPQVRKWLLRDNGFSSSSSSFTSCREPNTRGGVRKMNNTPTTYNHTLGEGKDKHIRLQRLTTIH